MKITFNELIDTASGRMGNKYGVCTHTHRDGTIHSWSVKYGKRSTQPAQAELTRQQKFASVAASTKTRMQNPTTLAQDKVAFQAQTKYNTLRGYVFAQEWANYAG